MHPSALLLLSHPAAAQGLILFVYLLNQGIKKKAFKEEKTEQRYQAKVAERNGPVAAPAGVNGAPVENGHNVYTNSIPVHNTRLPSV